MYMKLIAATIIFAAIIAAFILPLYIYVRAKDGKRDKHGLFTVSKYGSRWETPVLAVLGLASFCGIILCGTLCYIYEETIYGYIFSPIIFAFCLIMSMGAISNKYAYVVFRDDGLLNASIFKKDVEIPYSSIRYYGWLGYRRILGLIDEYGLGACFYDIHYRTRSEKPKILDLLISKSILEIPNYNKLSEMQNNKVFKRRNSLEAFIFTAIACVICVAVAVYIMLISTVIGVFVISYCLFGLGGLMAAIAIYYAVKYAKYK